MKEQAMATTPGPWTAERPRSKSDVSSIRKVAVSARTPEGLLYVADLCGPAETVMANARLIAASPELLDALKAMVACDDDRGWGGRARAGPCRHCKSRRQVKEQPMPVTRESIEKAKQQQRADREMVYRMTGVLITEDGRIQLGKQS